MPYPVLVLRNFLQALIAVVAGNAVYFLVLWPYLPQRVRHGIGRFDLGLLVDFWVCTLIFAAVKLLWREKRHP